MDIWEIAVVNYDWDNPHQIIRVATEKPEIEDAVLIAKSKISDQTRIESIKYLYGVYIKNEQRRV